MKKLFIIVAAVSYLDSAVAMSLEEEEENTAPKRLIDMADTKMHPPLLVLEPLPSPYLIGIDQCIEEESQADKTLDAIMPPSQPNYHEIAQSVHEINDWLNGITIYSHHAGEGMEKRYILDGGFFQSRKPKLSIFERIMFFFSCC